MYPLEIQLAQTLAAGQAVTGVTWDVVHGINATHARDYEGVTKAEGVAFQRARLVGAAVRWADSSETPLISKGYEDDFEPGRPCGRLAS